MKELWTCFLFEGTPESLKVDAFPFFVEFWHAFVLQNQRELYMSREKCTRMLEQPLLSTGAVSLISYWSYNLTYLYKMYHPIPQLVQNKQPTKLFACLYQTSKNFRLDIHTVRLIKNL